MQVQTANIDQVIASKREEINALNSISNITSNIPSDYFERDIAVPMSHQSFSY
jgi:hypothetical protein